MKPGFRAATIAFLSFVTSACWLGRAPATPRTSNPRFDWFEYQGTDDVYKTIPASDSAYLNPILAGFYPDPSITRVGEDYYLVNSSFAYFPGVPLFHSTDLASWTQLGSVLTRRSQLDLDSAGISRGIYAPTIRYHDGTYYMITTLVDRGGNFYVTAKDPAGPWSDPVWLPSVDGIDPSFFFDDDGKAWVVNNGEAIEKPRYDGHRAIWIQEFDIASGKMVGPRSLIVNGGVDITTNPIWIEGPHILKHDGAYFLICAEGGTGDQHSEVVFRSGAPTGPYTPFKGNPILTQRHLDKTRTFPVTSTGHADFVDTPDGEWWAVFLGTRPYGDDTYNTGRETFMLPVKWVDGWPIVLSGNETVSFAPRRSRLAPSPAAAVPMHGNFTWRDEFDAATLAPAWVTIRHPADARFDLASSPGSLTLHPADAGFEAAARPTFIGRRQQHLNATATTSMTYVPANEGDKAGIVAFQNDEYYYYLAVARVNGETRVQLEKHAPGRRGGGGVVASAPISVDASNAVYLRIEARASVYHFAYATREGDWNQLGGDMDGAILSTRMAGGFVGTMIGLYAYSAPQHE